MTLTRPTVADALIRSDQQVQSCTVVLCDIGSCQRKRILIAVLLRHSVCAWLSMDHHITSCDTFSFQLKWCASLADLDTRLAAVYGRVRLFSQPLVRMNNLSLEHRHDMYYRAKVVVCAAPTLLPCQRHCLSLPAHDSLESLATNLARYHGRRSP